MKFECLNDGILAWWKPQVDKVNLPCWFAHHELSKGQKLGYTLGLPVQFLSIQVFHKIICNMSEHAEHRPKHIVAHTLVKEHSRNFMCNLFKLRMKWTPKSEINITGTFFTERNTHTQAGRFMIQSHDLQQMWKELTNWSNEFKSLNWSWHYPWGEVLNI